jgi:hypothetical protein
MGEWVNGQGRSTLRPHDYRRATNPPHISPNQTAEFSRAREGVTMPKRFPLPDPARSTDNLAMPSSLTPQTFPRRAPLAHAIAALAVQIEPDAAGAPPTDVRLIPAGEFRAVDGRPSDCPAWVMDAADGQRCVSAMAARDSASVIDYEHATRCRPSGPAARRRRRAGTAPWNGAPRRPVGGAA